MRTPSETKKAAPGGTGTTLDTAHVADSTVSPADRIQIVAAVKRPDGTYIRLTKKIMADGKVLGYDRAKAVKPSHRNVSSIHDVGRVIGELQSYSNKAIIRGDFVGKENVLAEKNVRDDGTPLREGTYLRNALNFQEVPRHWMMLDVDEYADCSHDPVREPEAATREFIQKELPECFHDVTFVWQLSSSAGTKGKERLLKVHLWFWLSRSWGSSELKIWAEALNHQRNMKLIDTSVYQSAQLHYCAAPVLGEGVQNPVPERLGIWESPDGKDEVTLALTAEMLLDAEKVQNAACQLEFKDQSTKPGHVGLFYRAFPDWNDIVFGVLDGHFEEGDAELRLTWLGSDSGALNGAWITGPNQHHIGASHNSWPWGANRVVTLFDCVRELVFNEDGKDDVLPEDDFERFGMEERKDFEKPSYKAMCKWMDEQPEVIALRKAESTAGSQLAKRIISRIGNILGRDDHEALTEEIGLDEEAIEAVFASIAWAPLKSKFILMSPTDGQGLLYSSEKDLATIAEGHFGKLISNPDPAVMRFARDREKDEKWVARTVAAIRKMPIEIIRDEAKTFRQMGQFELAVDMFSDKSSMALDDGICTLRFKHRPFCVGEIDPSVIADYRQHFPQFDDVIRLLAASRFASSRKKSHLWLNCSSDWGKSFLMFVLEELGLVITTSTDELGKMIAGGPVGKTIEQFKTVWVLAIDEFKKVTSEVKQLSETISFAAKGLPTTKAPLYLKLFLSAETVDSLASHETGIEDQFANRFTLINATGNIEERPLFMRSKKSYRDSLVSYVGSKLNQLVSAYQAMGEVGAADQADADIQAFYDKYRIDHKYARISTKISELADRLKSDIARAYNATKIESGFIERTRFQRDIMAFLVETPKNGLCLSKPVKAVEMWLQDSFSKAELGMLGYKKQNIADAIGKPVTIYGFGGERFKGLPLGIPLNSEPGGADDDFGER